MTSIDYIVVALYLIFMLSIGPVYGRFSSTASDYFRGGGGMLWWMVGASSWVMAFTAWTFTGAAGEVYRAGTFYFTLIIASLFAAALTMAIGPWFRQMRVITGIEAVFQRYGRSNEQFFTWVPVPFGIVFGGLGLYAIGLFMAVVFDVQIWQVIIGLGAVVTFMSVMGGSWAVVASDFVQMLTVMVITMVVTFLALRHPDVGGLGGMLEQVPASHFDWTAFDRPAILWLFFITLIINQVVQGNSIVSGSAKYVFCKTGRDVRKALWVSIAGTLIFVPIFILPAMTATVIHPELEVMADIKPRVAELEKGQAAPIADLSQAIALAQAGHQPELAAQLSEAQAMGIELDDTAMKMNNPREGAYVLTAMSVLPAGMLGLLVCGVFAATMSSMDSGLNRAAGILVRNFYIVLINREANDARQLMVGKVVTLLLGLAQIVMGLIFIQFKDIKLFDLVLLMAAILGMPMAVPLLFGMFVKKTPPWSGWSTVLVGFAAAMILHPKAVGLLTDEAMQGWFGQVKPLSPTELGHLNLAVTTGVIFSACALWYLGTMFFYRYSSPEYKQNVEKFFVQMKTPVDPVAEQVAGWEEDRKHYNVMGTLCMIYGGFILLLALFPNPWIGRLCFVFCAACIGGLGVVLWLIGRRPGKGVR